MLARIKSGSNSLQAEDGLQPSDDGRILWLKLCCDHLVVFLLRIFITEIAQNP
jgi:hypothetical protein